VRADLVVVGGGVIGLSCAWRAIEAGLETVVLDSALAGRASSVAAGMIAPVGEATWGEEALLAAAVVSADAWPDFAAELERAAGVEVPYRRRGALHVALDRDEAARLDRFHDLHVRLELESERRRGREAREIEPGLAAGVVSALEAPGEAEIDPRALLEALRAAVLAAGGRIENGAEVRELLIDGGTVRGVVRASGDRVEASQVLVATGAWAGGELLPDAIRPPVRPLKGEIVRLRARPGERICEHLIATERIYVVPRDGEEVVVGATVEDLGFDLRVTAGGVHELLREAYRVLPEVAELELAECSVGLRPSTPDNAPVVGRTEIDGLLVAAGHGRNGILLAPITAAGIAAALGAGETPPALAELGPGRFTETRA